MDLNGFVDCLNSESNAEVMNGLKSFVKQAHYKNWLAFNTRKRKFKDVSKERVNLIDEYVKSSPNVVELMKLWHDKTTGKSSHENNLIIVRVIEALAMILLCGDKTDNQVNHSCKSIAKFILQNKMKLFHSYFSSTIQHICASLKLLIALSSLSFAITRELLQRFNFDHANFLKLLHKTDHRKDGVNDDKYLKTPRSLTIGLAISLLKNSDINTMKDLLAHRNGFVTNMFKNLAQDPPIVIRKLLDTVSDTVTSNQAVGNKAKLNLFTWTSIDHMLRIYKLEDEEMRSYIHSYLKQLLESKLFQTTSASSSMIVQANHQQHCDMVLRKVLTWLKPAEDSLQMELVEHILHRNQHLIGFYTNRNTLTIDPRLSFRWLASINATNKILCLPLPPVSQELISELSQTASSVDQAFEQLFPNCISKSALSKGLQSKEQLVITMTLNVMLASLARCNAFLKSISARIADDITKQSVRRRVVGSLEQLLPDISVLITLRVKLLSCKMFEAGADVLDKTKWVYRTLLACFKSYTTVMPTAAKFDIGKLLPRVLVDSRSSVVTEEQTLSDALIFRSEVELDAQAVLLLLQLVQENATSVDWLYKHPITRLPQSSEALTVSHLTNLAALVLLQLQFSNDVSNDVEEHAGCVRSDVVEMFAATAVAALSKSSIFVGLEGDLFDGISFEACAWLSSIETIQHVVFFDAMLQQLTNNNASNDLCYSPLLETGFRQLSAGAALWQQAGCQLLSRVAMQLYLKDGHPQLVQLINQHKSCEVFGSYAMDLLLFMNRNQLQNNEQQLIAVSNNILDGLDYRRICYVKDGLLQNTGDHTIRYPVHGSSTILHASLLLASTVVGVLTHYLSGLTRLSLDKQQRHSELSCQVLHQCFNHLIQLADTLTTAEQGNLAAVTRVLGCNATLNGLFLSTGISLDEEVLGAFNSRMVELLYSFSLLRIGEYASIVGSCVTTLFDCAMDYVNSNSSNYSVVIALHGLHTLLSQQQRSTLVKKIILQLQGGHSNYICNIQFLVKLLLSDPQLLQRDVVQLLIELSRVYNTSSALDGIVLECLDQLPAKDSVKLLVMYWERYFDLNLQASSDARRNWMRIMQRLAVSKAAAVKLLYLLADKLTAHTTEVYLKAILTDNQQHFDKQVFGCHRALEVLSLLPPVLQGGSAYAALLASEDSHIRGLCSSVYVLLVKFASSRRQGGTSLAEAQLGSMCVDTLRHLLSHRLVPFEAEQFRWCMNQVLLDVSRPPTALALQLASTVLLGEVALDSFDVDDVVNYQSLLLVHCLRQLAVGGVDAQPFDIVNRLFQRLAAVKEDGCSLLMTVLKSTNSLSLSVFRDSMDTFMRQALQAPLIRCADAVSTVRKLLLFIYADGKPKQADSSLLRPVQVQDILVSHASFFELLGLSGTCDESLQLELVRLLLTCTELKPVQCCRRQMLLMYLSVYRGSLSLLDRALRRLLYIYERHELSPLLVGYAFNQVITPDILNLRTQIQVLEKDDDEVNGLGVIALLNQRYQWIHSSELLADGLKFSIYHFPVARDGTCPRLQSCSSLSPTSEEVDDDVQQLNEDETRMLAQTSDPSFILPLLLHFVSLYVLTIPDVLNKTQEDEKEVDCEDTTQDEQPLPEDDFTQDTAVHFPARQLVENGAVSFCVMSLASQHVEIRRLAYTVLQYYCQVAVRNTAFRERYQVILLLRSFRDGIEDEYQQVTPLLLRFVCEALTILLRPSHSLYTSLNNFLLQRPWLDLSDVPMFYSMFNSGSSNYLVERKWMVRLVVRGTYGKSDLDVLTRRHVVDVTVSFFNSSLSDPAMKLWIAKLYYRIAHVAGGRRFLLHMGLLPFVVSQLARLQVVAASSDKERMVVYYLLHVLWRLVTSKQSNTDVDNIKDAQRLIAFKSVLSNLLALAGASASDLVQCLVASYLHLLRHIASDCTLSLCELRRLLLLVPSDAGLGLAPRDVEVAVKSRTDLFGLPAQVEHEASVKGGPLRLVDGQTWGQVATRQLLSLLFRVSLASRAGSQVAFEPLMCRVLDRLFHYPSLHADGLRWLAAELRRNPGLATDIRLTAELLHAISQFYSTSQSAAANELLLCFTNDVSGAASQVLVTFVPCVLECQQQYQGNSLVLALVQDVLSVLFCNLGSFSEFVNYLLLISDEETASDKHVCEVCSRLLQTARSIDSSRNEMK